MDGWTVGRLDGLAWWTDWMEGRVGGWVDGRVNVGSGMEPAQSTRCFSPHQAKRGLGLETRVGEDEKTSTAHGCMQAVCSAVSRPILAAQVVVIPRPPLYLGMLEPACRPGLCAQYTVPFGVGSRSGEPKYPPPSCPKLHRWALAHADIALAAFSEFRVLLGAFDHQ